MKKSLSTILALAMTFSAFTSIALADDAAKSSADFSDLKDLDAATKAKFDAMISAGVFDGVGDGKFGLKDEMNRAQFAKVAAIIFNLKVDSSLKTSSFTDVKADDPANGYALPYIEAVKAAGITDGYGEGIFNPAGKVTKEQLAAFLVRGLGKDKDAKATPGVNDATVTDWAKGYVALALQLKVLSNGADGKFGGSANATRDLLVLGAYEAKSQWKPTSANGKVGIAELKATDANVLKLTFNAAVDTAAAKLEVKKDGNVVASSDYKVAWSESNTVATLTFANKFQDSTYVVNFSGVSNLDDALKTAQVAVTKERIAKIEFLTASDTLPKSSRKLRIDFKATNQYGAKSSLTYNNFTINTGSNISWSGISGEQAFNIQMPAKDGGAAGEASLDRNERISVTIIHEDSGATANKVFAIGDLPNVAKIEVGDLKNSSNVKLDSVEAEKETYLDFKAYDQYGIPVQDREDLNKGITVYSSEGNVERVADGDNGKVWFASNEIGDDAADLKFKYNKKEAKDNITLTLIANGSGQQVTKSFKVNAPKTPATVEFGSYSYTLAENDALTTDSDMNKKFYVPIIVKDAKGDTLTPQEIVDSADKFTIYATGSIYLDSFAGSKGSTPIVQTGEHKGKIAIKNVGSKGNAGITVQLLDTPTVKASFSTSVGDKRVADKIAFTTNPKKYMINGTDNEFKIKIYDQHGGEMKIDDPRYAVQLKLKANTDISSVSNATYANQVKGVLPIGTVADSNGNFKDANGNLVNAQGYRVSATGTPLSAKYYGMLVRSQFVSDENSSNPLQRASTAKKYNLNISSLDREVTTTYFNGTDYVANPFIPLNDVFDKSYRFMTNGNNNTGSADRLNKNGSSDIVVPDTSYTLTATLYKLKNNGNFTSSTTASDVSSISEITTTLEVLNTSDDKNKLTYEVYLDKQVNNTILAADDYLGGLGTTGVASATYLYQGQTYNGVNSVNTPYTGIKFTGPSPLTSAMAYDPGTTTPSASNGVNYPFRKFGTEVKVRAKNSSGQDVSIPSNVTSIVSSNPSVVAEVQGLGNSSSTSVGASTGPNGTTAKQILGLDAGVATLNVMFTDAKGEIKSGSIEVTSKNEAPSVKSIALKNSGGTLSRAALTQAVASSLGGFYAWDKGLAEKITVKDQFGHEFVSDRAPGTQKDDGGGNTDQFFMSANQFLNVTFYASDIVTSDKQAGSVTINSKTGLLTAVSSNVTSFTLNILAPSGVTASVAVTVTP